MVEAQRLKLSRVLPCSTAKLAVLHGRSATWFQTSRYCRAKFEFNSISLVRHGSSTTFETGFSERSELFRPRSCQASDGFVPRRIKSDEELLFESLADCSLLETTTANSLRKDHV